MDMEVRDFLPQAVVYRQLIMVGDTQLLGHDLGGFQTDPKSFRRRVLEVGIFLFGDNQQVDRGFGAMVGDHDDLVGLVEDFGGASRRIMRVKMVAMG